MWTWLWRRLVLSALLLFVVATILFFSIHLLPGDPALLILGGDSAQPTPEQIARVRARLGLDRPLAVQYATWLARVARGDLGSSLVDDRPVATDLANRLPRTLQLVVGATLVSIGTGVPLGMFAARRRGRDQEHRDRGAGRPELTGAGDAPPRGATHRRSRSRRSRIPMLASWGTDSERRLCRRNLSWWRAWRGPPRPPPMNQP